MNAERLHVIARAIQKEIAALKLVENLEQLRDSLKNQVNQPQQPAFQQAVSQKLTEIYKTLENAPSDEFSPAWRQILVELRADNLLGKRLATSIRSIFERNQITPAAAQQEIQQLHQNVSRLKSAVDSLRQAFDALSISAEELQPGECELGVLVPRSAVDNELGEFADELGEIEFILKNFAELVTGKREGFKIRAISSSDLSLYLQMMPPVAACIAFAVERLIQTYKSLLEIRKLHSELKKQGVAETALTGVEQHANGIMDAGIEAVIPDIVKTYCNVKDERRRNELTNGLRISLTKLANRIDRGYNIEIRVEPIKNLTDRTSPSESNKQNAAHLATILEKVKTMEFMKIDGEPLLSLPETKPAQTRRRKPKQN